jgi:translation elongation factor EF-G
VQSQINDLRIHVYGHISADPAEVASVFNAQVSQSAVPESDLAIFAIDPSAGIDQVTIDLWQSLDEFQVPRLVVVTHLEKLEADFDDAVMIATRVFDQMITPYLVLHDEAGLPAALISLSDLQIIDYSTNPKTTKSSEEEHQTLVQEFRDEYLELLVDSGENAFSAGLLFPAIPLWIERGIGVDIVESYIKQLVV